MIDQENSIEVLLGRPEKINPRTPDREYISDLFERYEQELESLPGLNALTRPYEQHLTIGEIIYDINPAEVMEFNRTVMNVWLYDLVRGEQSDEEIQRSYATFIDCQKSEKALTFEDFIELKHITDSSIPPEREEIFRAMLVYSDLGKSTRMQKYMQDHRGVTYADHDKLLADVLKDPEAIAYCIPSFLTFTAEEQAYMRTCLASGFHLGQYQKLETLPVHLLGIQALPPQQRDSVMLTGLFDIAGAAGDKMQNGTPVLDHATFTAFTQARASVHMVDTAANGATEIDLALKSYQSYLETRNEAFGFDATTREGRAFTRFVCMFRVLTPGEIEKVSGVFHNNLNGVTQELFVDLLDATGLEKNALWIEYGPALVRNLYSEMRSAGFTSEQSLSEAMRTLARICNGARRVMDRHDETESPATIMAAPLAHAVQSHWVDLVKKRITYEAADSSGEFIAKLAPVPAVEVTSDNRLSNLNELKNTDGKTMVIGAGGGSDCVFARFASETLLGVKDSPVVSFPGVASSEIRNARQISDTVFLASTTTFFKNKRSFESIAAKAGPCYVIANVGKNEPQKLNEAYRTIQADIEATLEDRVTRILTVDAGGDVLQSPGDAWSRDAASIRATQALDSGIESDTIILIPGVGAPQELNDIASSLGVNVYDMTAEERNAFKALCEAENLPTAHPNRYSQLISIARRALENTDIFGLHGLEVPGNQVHKNNRPAFGITARSMGNVLVVKNRELIDYLT